MAARTFKVGYLIGSLATKSINRVLARALVRLAPPTLQMSEIPIGDLPLYSYDYDADYPAVATASEGEPGRRRRRLAGHPGIQPVDSRAC